MTAGPLLSVKDLRVRYGPALALDIVCFEVIAGQALAVLGPNGAGKSTLARAVSGLIPAQSGAVTLLPRDGRKPAIEHGLEIFPNLAARRGMKAGMLSGGEQQMLSLCRAFILRPKLITADELSLGLAPKLVELVFDSLARLKQDGVTIVLVEQFVHRALEFAEHAVLLYRGRVAWHGPSGSARHEVLARYLGETAAAGAA